MSEFGRLGITIQIHFNFDSSLQTINHHRDRFRPDGALSKKLYHAAAIGIMSKAVTKRRNKSPDFRNFSNDKNAK